MKREDNKRSEIPTTRARTDVKSQTQSREICPIWPEDIQVKSSIPFYSVHPFPILSRFPRNIPNANLKGVLEAKMADAKKMSPEERFQKALQDIQTWKKNPVVAEALLITLKLIFYHGFTAKKVTDLKMEDVRTLPQDLESVVMDYIQHLQVIPNSSMNPDSPLFPCYQGKGELMLQRFLSHHQCPNPESLRELGIKHNFDTLLREGMESSEAVIEIAKKFGEKEEKVRTILGWVDPSRFLKKKIQNNYWDELSFLRVLESRGGSEEAKVAERILQWTKEKGFDLKSGTGFKIGALFPTFRFLGKTYWSFSIWTHRVVKIESKKLKNPPFNKEKVLELRELLNKIPGVSIAESEMYQKPKIPLSVLLNEDALKEFLSVIEWVISQVGEKLEKEGKLAAGRSKRDGSLKYKIEEAQKKLRELLKEEDQENDKDL